jgi:hypothetical protein
MSLRGVVENLVATPSSQDRAFCSDTPGATETMSDPTDANPLATPHSAAAAAAVEPFALLASADAMGNPFSSLSLSLCSDVSTTRMIRAAFLD